MKKQTLYAVEKFVPTHCPQPGCQNHFARNGDGEGGFLLATFWRHAPKEVVGAIFKSISHAGIATDLIICGKCHHATLRVKIESRHSAKRSDAERFLKEGFVNFTRLEHHGAKRFRGIECYRSLLVREGATCQEAMLFTKGGVHRFSP